MWVIVAAWSTLTLKVAVDQKLFVTTFFKITSVQTKKESNSGLKQLELFNDGEWVNDGIKIKHCDIIDRQMTIFIFVWTIPLILIKN